METLKERIFLHRTWAVIRTAWVFVIRWGAELLGIYLSTPLAVLLGMLILKNHFTFSQYVEACDRFFSSVLPFIVVIAGIRFGWTFPSSDWYNHFLEQREIHHEKKLAEAMAIHQKILDERRRLGFKDPHSD